MDSYLRQLHSTQLPRLPDCQTARFAAGIEPPAAQVGLFFCQDDASLRHTLFLLAMRAVAQLASTSLGRAGGQHSPQTRPDKTEGVPVSLVCAVSEPRPEATSPIL